jgi:hypothetical protein
MHAAEARAITGVFKDPPAAMWGGRCCRRFGILTMRIVLMIGHGDALERAAAV